MARFTRNEGIVTHRHCQERIYEYNFLNKRDTLNPYRRILREKFGAQHCNNMYMFET